MELSIIVPIYGRKKELTIFLKKILEQTTSQFEVVFVVDTNLENSLDLIQNYTQKIKSKNRIIFNSKRIGRNKAIQTGLEVATGKFSLIASTSNIIENDFVEEIHKLIKKKNADIIEFQAFIKEPIKLKGKMRTLIWDVVNIVDKPLIIAYTYPFDFNKIWKTEIIKKAYKCCSKIIVNSRFSIEHIYNAFFLSKTYSNSNKIIVVAKSCITQRFNPLKIFEQWNLLQKYLKSSYKDKYVEEILYAEFMHKSIFLSALVGVSKNKILIKKVSDIYNKNLKNKFQKFLYKNKYGILKNNETNTIRENTKIHALTKAYKEIW